MFPVALFKKIRGHFYRYNINVIDNNASLKEVLKNDLSVIRFGDGEFDIISGRSIPYQRYEKKLAQNMEKIILGGSSDNVLVCLPDVFSGMNRYNKDCQNFYYESFFYQNRYILQKIQLTYKKYGSTFLSRPYIDIKDKSNAADYFDKLKMLWEKRDVLIIEGKYTRSGENNDLFDNAKSVKRIIAPSRNAFDKYQLIERSILENSGDRLILLMLGPTSKIIVDDLKNKQKVSNQIIDIGHIDSEYEWFKMGATKKVKIPHKHTAEFNNDDIKVDLLADKEYEQQIIDIVD